MTYAIITVIREINELLVATYFPQTNRGTLG